MTIQEYFGDWTKVLDLGKIQNIMSVLKGFKGTYCPLLKDTFKAFRKCDYNGLRVVVLSQDPYPQMYNGQPIATGIAFANPSNLLRTSYSPSLQILMESVMNLTVPQEGSTFDPSLESWEEQGVLLLNSALTCDQGKPGSHTLLWRPFTQGFLDNLSRNKTGIVYVLMGKVAQSFEGHIDHRFNHVIKVNHPSYYARTCTKLPSSVWKQVNDILIGQNGYGIEWYKKSGEQESKKCHSIGI